MIRTLWVAFNALLATAVFGIPVIVLAYLRPGRQISDWYARSWARWILARSRVTVHAEGLENIRLDEPQVFVANHQSWSDIFALAVVIPKPYRFIGKKELARIPLFGKAWLAAGHVAIDRSDRAEAIRALDAAGRIIREDKSSIIIFPEGTRSRTGELLPFKKGAFMLALRTDVDIVPVAVLGSRSVLPKGEWRIRPGPIIVRFGEPISMRDWATGDRDRLIEHVRARIQALLDRPAPMLLQK